MKRAVITKDKFRISVPGVDVDVASDFEFILHEDHLSAQPYFMTWVPCPLTGVNNNNGRSATVAVTVPEVTNSTIIFLYLEVSDEGGSYYPVPPSDGGTRSTGAQALLGLDVGTTVNITFGVPQTVRAPIGAFLILMRSGL